MDHSNLIQPVNGKIAGFRKLPLPREIRGRGITMQNARTFRKGFRHLWRKRP